MYYGKDTLWVIEFTDRSLQPRAFARLCLSSNITHSISFQINCHLVLGAPMLTVKTSNCCDIWGKYFETLIFANFVSCVNSPSFYLVLKIKHCCWHPGILWQWHPLCCFSARILGVYGKDNDHCSPWPNIKMPKFLFSLMFFGMKQTETSAIGVMLLKQCVKNIWQIRCAQKKLLWILVNPVLPPNGKDIFVTF